MERVTHTLKEQCVHRHRFESLQHPTSIQFYNHRRPSPPASGAQHEPAADAFALAADLCRFLWVHSVSRAVSRPECAVHGGNMV